MLNRLYPYAYVDSVFAIDYPALYQMGYRGLVFDVDNTLVHHGDDATPEVEALFRSLQEMGFKTLLLSDNTRERLQRFTRQIDTPFICDAGKPSPDAYLQAVRLLGLEKKEVVCIGDQIFTDILGANRSGLASILVKFIRLDSETRFGKRRQVERAVLWFYRRNRRAHRLGI